MHRLIVPMDAWDGDNEAAVAQWFFNHGATVKKGALVAEVMMDKATIEISAIADGKLSINAPINTVVKRGDLLATIA